jgi:peptidoglycan/LPS O-acetylase OafA/YrhL
MITNYKLTKGNSVLLDLIRGISAQLVVVGHGISFFGIFTFLHEPNTPWMQNIAVLIFFLLSGFLITYSTINKIILIKEYDFKHYLIDRVARIYTAFVPALLFVFFVDFLSKYLNPSVYNYTNSYNFKTFLGNLFMFQDFFKSLYLPNFITSFGSGRPFWTLAIEWWIYLWFGFLILVVFRVKKTDVFTIIIITFLSIVPFYNVINGRGNGLTIYWLFGVLIYLLSVQNILNNIKDKIKFLILSLILFLALARVFYVMEAYDPIFAFLLALGLWITIDIYKNKVFSDRIEWVIKYNSSYSYTLYLVHYSIFDFIKSHFDESYNPYLLFVFGFLVSNIISVIIGRYTELKLTKLVKRNLYNHFIK